MITLKNIKLGYHQALVEGELKIYPNELTLIKGPTGSGKTTLLYELGMLSHGRCTYYWNNQCVDHSNQRTAFKRQKISFVFQDNLLFDHLSVEENLSLYASMDQVSLSTDEMQDLLDLVSLKISLKQDVRTLSGGEKQRVAIACALAKKPELLILDEPTSALDLKNEENLFDLLKKIALERQLCVVLASHSPHAINHCDCVYEIKNKKLVLVKEGKNKDYKDHQVKEMNSFFSKNYLKISKHSLKRYHILTSLSLGLLLLISIVSNSYVRVYKDEQVSFIDSISANKVWVDCSEEDLLKAFKNVTYYPFYKDSIMLNHRLLYVYPYFEEDKLEPYTDRTYLENNLIIYGSDSLFKENILSKDQLEITINETSYTVTTRLFSSSDQLYQSQYYILVPYQLLENTKHDGYMMYFDTFLEVVEANDFLTGLKTNATYRSYNLSYQDIIKYSKMIDESSIQSIFVSGILNIIFVVLIILIHYQTLHYIDSHLILLKANGIESKELRMILFKQFNLHYLPVFLFMLLVTNILYFIYSKGYILSIVFVFLIVVYLLGLIIISLYIKKLNIINEIRM